MAARDLRQASRAASPSIAPGPRWGGQAAQSLIAPRLTGAERWEREGEEGGEGDSPEVFSGKGALFCRTRFFFFFYC